MKEDIKKIHKELYDVSAGRLEIVNVPAFNYLKIRGYGNPRTLDFKAQMLLMKLILKEIKKYYKSIGAEDEFVSAPIEGIWKTYGEQNIDIARETDIKYKMQVIVPDSFTQDILNDIMMDLGKTISSKVKRAAKKNDEEADSVYECMEKFLNDFYVKSYKEGHSIQTLHIGPYDQEINTTISLMEFIAISNLQLRGLHHEIYLNDYTKVEPARLKTIIRYPIR